MNTTPPLSGCPETRAKLNWPNTSGIWSGGNYKEAIRAAFQTLFNTARGSSLSFLYIGGGDGRTLVDLAQLASESAVSLHLDFVEPDASNIEAAKQRLLIKGLNPGAICWHESTIEEFFKDGEERKYNAIVALLVLHYLNANWPSVLCECAKRTKLDGLFVFDEPYGISRKSDERFRTIDCTLPFAKETTDPVVKSLRQGLLQRAQEKGAFWNVPLKGSDTRVLIPALTLLGYRSVTTKEKVGKRLVDIGRAHLPWVWGSDKPNEGDYPFEPDKTRPTLGIWERWFIWRKSVDKAYPEAAIHISDLAYARAFDNMHQVRCVEEPEGSTDLQEHLTSRVMPNLALTTLLNSGLIDYDSTLSSCFLVSSANALLVDATALDAFSLFVPHTSADSMLNKWCSHLRFFLRNQIPSLSTQLLDLDQPLLVTQEEEPSQMMDTFKSESTVPGVIKLPKMEASLPEFEKPSGVSKKSYIQWNSIVLSKREMALCEDAPGATSSYEELYRKCEPIAADLAIQDLVQKKPELQSVAFLLPLLNSVGSLLFFPVHGAWTRTRSGEWKPESFLLLGISYHKLTAQSVEEAHRLWRRFIAESQRLSDQLFYSRWRTRFIRRSQDAAVAAISAQSLSHNIGSHALSDAGLFSDCPQQFEDAKHDLTALKDFNHYLQGRMDYVAQLVAKSPPQPEPMYLFQDVLAEFFRQRLLLNRLVADRGCDGKKISFRLFFSDGSGTEEVMNLNWKDHIEPYSKQRSGRTEPLGLKGRDVLVGIPGGSVGRHALFSIFENLMRNSAKYGLKRKDDEFVISMRLRRADDKTDYWLLELWDSFSGFSAQEEMVAGSYDALCKSFSNDVIDEDGKTRTGGHGLVEVKEAMRFLHPHKDSPHKDGTCEPSPWACAPHCHRTSPNHPTECCGTECRKDQEDCCHANVANVWDAAYDSSLKAERGTLVYRVRLQRPRLLGVWAPGAEFVVEENCQFQSEGIFFRRGDKLSDPGPNGSPSLAELAPHLLVVRDAESINIQNVVDELAREHWGLPFRLMVLALNEDRRVLWLQTLREFESKVPGSPVTDAERDNLPFLPAMRVRVICDRELFDSLGNPSLENANLALVNRAYDTWLRAYKPSPDGKKWHLAVCFDRGDEIKRLWSAANTFVAESMTVSAYHYVPDDDKVTGAARRNLGVQLSAGENLQAGNGVIGRLVHFGNHGKAPKGQEFEFAVKHRTIPFSQMFGSKEAPRTFNLLYSPPTDPEGFKFFALSIVEAALTNLAIFDERAISMFFKDGESKQISGNRLSDAAISRLFPLVEIPSGTSNRATARDDIDWHSSHTLCSHTKFVYPQVDTANAENPPRPLELSESAADVLILHEGLIEELVSHHKFQLGRDTTFLARFSQIVRTSGKGRDARKLNQRLPFCEYSAISVLLAPYKDGNEELIRVEKILLAKAVMNCIGQVNRGGGQR